MRYLRARRTEAFISITTLLTAAGVMIGVAALTIVMAVMNGFEVNLRERVLSLTPQIQILSYDGAITDYADVAARANGVAGVTGSDPFLVGQAMVSSAHGISGVLIRGVEPDNPVVIGELGRYIDRGALKNLDRAYPSDPAESGRRADRGDCDRRNPRRQARAEAGRHGQAGRSAPVRSRRRADHQKRAGRGRRDLRFRRQLYRQEHAVPEPAGRAKLSGA